MKNSTTRTNLIFALRGLCLFSLLFFFSAFTANKSLSYKSKSSSTMNLSGYSKLNKWTMDYKSLVCEGSFNLKDGQLDEVNALEFNISTNMVEGDDAETNAALYHILANGSTEKISFKLSSQMVLPILKKVHLVGSFTLGGVTRTVSLYMDYHVDQDGNIELKGTNTISLANFTSPVSSKKLKALKCNDQLTFTLELNFSGKWLINITKSLRCWTMQFLFK